VALFHSHKASLVAINVAQSAQRSHDLLGFRSPTAIAALLTLERAVGAVVPAIDLKGAHVNLFDVFDLGDFVVFLFEFVEAVRGRGPPVAPRGGIARSRCRRRRGVCVRICVRRRAFVCACCQGGGRHGCSFHRILAVAVAVGIAIAIHIALGSSTGGTGGCGSTTALP